MIQLRHKIHQHAEGGFMEFKTQKLIRKTLTEFGISTSEIKDCARTGLLVNIHGTGDATDTNPGTGSTVNSVALRADMDGLPMRENNPHLPYKSVTDHAHMCGHDGHMATIISVAAIIHNNRHQIPKGKFVRLLFQPAEESPGGASPMIKEGCLENISEVYGFHNVPNFDEGDIRVCEDAIFAGESEVVIKVTG